MKTTTSWAGCTTLALASTLPACGDSTDAPAAPACHLPKSVEERFEAMKGPLGCDPTTAFVPDPPRGCEGATDLVARAQREYATLYADGGCTGDAPDLASSLASYETVFAAGHPFVEHRITRDGFTIAAREFGADHAGKGPTIVLMHGFPDNQHLYDAIAPALGESFQTITFDFVGWGASSLPPADYTYTVEGMRADLEAVLAHFAPSTVVPVVHDASGWPGIDWALDNQDAIPALVLLNTTYHALPGLAPPYVIRALSATDLRATFLDALGPGDLMNRALFRAQVGQFFTNEGAKAKHLPVLEASIMKARSALVGLTEHLQDIVLARTAKLDQLRAFSKPVHIAFGEDDPFLNVNVAQDFAGVFPNSTVQLIPSASHYVQLDQPEAVVDAIRRAASEPASVP